MVVLVMMVVVVCPPSCCVLCRGMGHTKGNCPKEILPSIVPRHRSTSSSAPSSSSLPPSSSPSSFPFSSSSLQNNNHNHNGDDDDDVGDEDYGDDEHVQVLDEILMKIMERCQPSEIELREREKVRKELESVIREIYPGFRLHDHHKVDSGETFVGRLAQHNTRLLWTYSEIDERVKPLVYAMKRMAKSCQIDDASKGRLSSYAYTLMVIFFLQRGVHPPVLPVLQEFNNVNNEETIIEKWNVWFFDDLEVIKTRWSDYRRNRFSVGELWLRMMIFYSESFDFTSLVISIRQLEPVRKFEKSWCGCLIAIEDPFILDHNLGSVALYILKTLRHARNRFVVPQQDARIAPEDYFFNSKAINKSGPPSSRGCRKCGKIGHFIAECPLRKNNTAKVLVSSKYKNMAGLYDQRPKQKQHNTRNNNNDHNCISHGNNNNNNNNDDTNNNNDKIKKQMNSGDINDGSNVFNDNNINNDISTNKNINNDDDSSDCNINNNSNNGNNNNVKVARGNEDNNNHIHELIKLMHQNQLAQQQQHYHQQQHQQQQYHRQHQQHQQQPQVLNLPTKLPFSSVPLVVDANMQQQQQQHYVIPQQQQQQQPNTYASGEIMKQSVDVDIQHPKQQHSKQLQQQHPPLPQQQNRPQQQQHPQQQPNHPQQQPIFLLKQQQLLPQQILQQPMLPMFNTLQRPLIFYNANYQDNLYSNISQHSQHQQQQLPQHQPQQQPQQHQPQQHQPQQHQPQQHQLHQLQSQQHQLHQQSQHPQQSQQRQQNVPFLQKSNSNFLYQQQQQHPQQQQQHPQQQQQHPQQQQQHPQQQQQKTISAKAASKKLSSISSSYFYISCGLNIRIMDVSIYSEYNETIMWRRVRMQRCAHLPC
ncbi:hypothetical protein HELRODRAFT_178225 [Helobdella robusta]|uniref:CCHC-type domain-containing protein n=1 Tax=Helobdella robusta TaxID=6412 RepID=T1FCY6_HELRO|nr:hypothetical protein HELRODRAFT_178225 [Helobdella robusta]ESN97430.1 hypothetical protein HELRODRAFT_178225 [Helobdella robusta]